MQSGVQEAKRGLGAKDLVTTGVCIALYFVFMMAGSMAPSSSSASSRRSSCS